VTINDELRVCKKPYMSRLIGGDLVFVAKQNRVIRDRHLENPLVEPGQPFAIGQASVMRCWRNDR
jgi:hypothetical protein